MSKVKNIEIDLVNYDGGKDFQVQSEYVNETKMNIHVRRIDCDSESGGWSEDLEVFFHDGKGHVKTLKVGASPDKRTKVVGDVELSGCVMQKAEGQMVSEHWYPSYRPFRQYEHYPQYVDLHTFNKMFGSDIATLPGSIYAIGMHNGGAFISHDSYGEHDWRYEISMTIDFIWNVGFRMGTAPPTFYCLLSALDGYIEQVYPEKRVVARRVGDIEHRGETHVSVKKLRADEYPVFHAQKYVLAQSARSSVPHVIPVIDRYCFHHHNYNLYRSVHRGIPFRTKIPKLVYAGGERGSRFNFLRKRDIPMSPRKYFASDAVGKERVTAPAKMPRDEMILYKYILDIDGNASTWDATAWKLNSGSVIFKTETDWRQWFYDEYLPDVHFVCIKDDFSDLQEKIDWCEKNQDKCEDMIFRCKALFQRIYRHENIVQYMQNVIQFLEVEQSVQMAASAKE